MCVCVCVYASPCLLAQMESEIQRVKKLIPASVREAQFFRVRAALTWRFHHLLDFIVHNHLWLAL